MALVLANRVQETTATTGTGTITLAGAVAGYQSFAAIGDANTTYYTVTSGNNWEVGIGTYTSSGTTLSRDTVLSSSAGGTTKITLAGTSTVFADYPAEKSVNYDASSNVGIGTTSPASKLDIATGDLRFSGTGQRILGDMSNATVANRLAFQTTTANTNTNVHIIPNGTSTVAGLKIESDPAIVTGQNIGLDIVGGSDARISSGTRGAAAYVPMTFYTGGSERIRLSTSGNFGIGTSAPQGLLQVVAGTNDSLLLRGPISLGTGGSIYAVNAANSAIAPMEFGASVYSFAGGNVGIGITDPGYKLDIAAADTTAGLGYAMRIRGNATATAGAIQFTDSGVTAQWGFLAASAVAVTLDASVASAVLAFRTNSAERMRITSGGDVGIGTTPVQQNGRTLQVDGGAGAADFRLTNNTTGAAINNGGLYSLIGIDNYLWNLEAGFLSFGTSNAERMRILSTGAVGINTSSPAATFEVNGGFIAGAENTQTHPSPSAAGGFKAQWNFGNGTAETDFYNLFNSASESFRFYQSTGSGTAQLLYSMQSSTHILYTGGTERMRIDSSGNVLVGTSAVGNWSKLTALGSNGTGFAGITAVNSNGNVGIGGIQFASDTTYSKAAIGLLRNQANGVGDLVFYNAASTGAANWATTDECMRLTSGGNLGIGTTTPTYKLEVKGSPSWFRNFAGTPASPTETQDWPVAAFNIASFGDYTLQTMLAFTLPNDGNYDTGYSTWNFKLDQTASSTTSAGVIGMQFGGPGYLAFMPGGTEKARITSGGEVYIAGTTDQGAYNLQCNGTGVWGAGAYVNGSDRNLKEDIAPLADALGVVAALNPVTFRYKEEYSKDQSTQPGFIAQELQEALSGQVYLDGVVQAGPKHLNVAYQALVPILVKAIQELTVRVAQLEGN